jgi:hypothetical protein
VKYWLQITCISLGISIRSDTIDVVLSIQLWCLCLLRCPGQHVFTSHTPHSESRIFWRFFLYKIWLNPKKKIQKHRWPNHSYLFKLLSSWTNYRIAQNLSSLMCGLLWICALLPASCVVVFSADRFRGCIIDFAIRSNDQSYPLQSYWGLRADTTNMHVGGYKTQKAKVGLLICTNEAQKSYYGIEWLVNWMSNGWIQIHGDGSPFIGLRDPFQYNVCFTPGTVPTRKWDKPRPTEGLSSILPMVRLLPMCDYSADGDPWHMASVLSPRSPRLTGAFRSLPWWAPFAWRGSSGMALPRVSPHP